MALFFSFRDTYHEKFKPRQTLSFEFHLSTIYYFQTGAKYETWCIDPGIALAVFAQLAHDFGWNAYKSVFRIYNTLPTDKHPKTRGEKRDMWIVTFSDTVKRNLCPVYEFWGWPIRNDVLESARHYPFYLPDDETTNSYAKEKADSISHKYNYPLNPVEHMEALLDWKQEPSLDNSPRKNDNYQNKQSHRLREQIYDNNSEVNEKHHTISRQGSRSYDSKQNEAQYTIYKSKSSTCTCL